MIRYCYNNIYKYTILYGFTPVSEQMLLKRFNTIPREPIEHTIYSFMFKFLNYIYHTFNDLPSYCMLRFDLEDNKYILYLPIPRKNRRDYRKLVYCLFQPENVDGIQVFDNEYYYPCTVQGEEDMDCIMALFKMYCK